MIPDEFEYARPSSLAEALQLLADRGDDAKVLAGGHSLIPMMKMRPRAPRPAGRHRPHHGAAWHPARRRRPAHRRRHDPRRDSVIGGRSRGRLRPYRRPAGLIGDRQVRARGTIGGSHRPQRPGGGPARPRCWRSTPRSWRGRPTGERVIPAASFFRGMLDADLAPNELVTEIRVPSAARSAYVKMPNPASHYAIVGVAAVSGNGGTRHRHHRGRSRSRSASAGAESALAGKALTSDAIADASSKAHDGRELLSDIHASAEYRGHLIGV